MATVKTRGITALPPTKKISSQDLNEEEKF
jgi:hypothetical protein